MLNSELLQYDKQSLTDRQLKRLKTIDISCNDLSSFINNLLDAAKMNSDDMTPELASLNIRNYFNQHLMKYEELAAKKNISLKLNIAENMPVSIMTDVDWLDKIFSNLTTNAIKFTMEGTITIAIEPKNTDTWQLSISDTGIGIPPEALDMIFQPFWQVDGSTTRQANRGVGLGLSIVHRFVKNLQGTIKVKSKENEGTTFTIQFPIHLSEAINVE